MLNFTATPATAAHHSGYGLRRNHFITRRQRTVTVRVSELLRLPGPARRGGRNGSRRSFPIEGRTGKIRLMAQRPLPSPPRPAGQRMDLTTSAPSVMDMIMEPPSVHKVMPNGKRTTSVRLHNLDALERVVREFGFKDRSHFFQLCTDALLQVHGQGQRLDWPPRFVTRE